ncbi:BspA family leucine-rich repeat surface protein [Campylobacter lari]|nr:BspA family leucine-rich repeat surface protein [Campylobacter lari]EAI4827816.1 BspA family leucine-rich repeat surface protein [Campylobacter lari]EAK0793952.1 BspA family leucine-rich repeat surface protein [Campylobacter lari]EAK5584361.1 BspA family leucine-rich repeat surface protein [Campylobacter lari]EGK8020270.1 BspA family leucine-rich repeat surface protein [Campylobacter lari]
MLSKKYHPKTKEELFDLIKNEEIHLSSIDTSSIVDMSYLFYYSKRKNFSGIEKWNVSNVKNMTSMFCGCKSFNQPLNEWNVSNVKDMYGMFEDCDNFNQRLNGFNVAN